MKVEIAVINYKTYDLLQSFIDSIVEFPPSVDHHLTIIDVDSDLEKAEALSVPEDSWLVLSDWNLGYALSCNYAGFSSDADILGFFNADTKFVNATCIDYCIDFLNSHPEVGIVGPLQYDSEGRVTHGGIFGSLSKPEHHGWRSKDLNRMRFNRKAVTVSGSAFFIKRSLWSDLTNCEIYRSCFPDVIGPFLPTEHYYEETGCAYHAQAHGSEVWYLGEAEMIHEWHKSSPIGGEADKNMKASKSIFVDFCEAHGIDHD